MFTFEVNMRDSEGFWVTQFVDIREPDIANQADFDRWLEGNKTHGDIAESILEALSDKLDRFGDNIDNYSEFEWELVC